MASVSDISPVRQGQTDPPAQWNLRNLKGDIVPLPTGTVFTLYLYNTSTEQLIIGSGTWDTTNIASGIATYNWNTNDTQVVGEYKVFAAYVTPGGGHGFIDEVDFVVKPLNS